mgnify:CR=1 FL=1
MTHQYRPHVGDFSNIVCFKAVITGVEDTLGTDGAAVVFIRAGRVRGHSLARELGVSHTALPTPELAPLLNTALGASGTRLCAVTRSYEDAGRIIIEARETVCSAGEPQGSPRECTFTLGAVWGALEEITGRSYLGRHIASVLRGSDTDTFEFTPLD